LPFLDDCQGRYGDVFTMRLPGTPPFVVLSDPEAIQEVFTGDPQVLRAGDANAVLQVAFGRRELYPEPEAFRPERFLERPAGTSTWIPFGGGTRRCLGAPFATLELKTVLPAVARAGEVGAAHRGDEETARRGITLVPARGGRILWHPHR
jgi:cytochrome P450